MTLFLIWPFYNSGDRTLYWVTKRKRAPLTKRSCNCGALQILVSQLINRQGRNTPNFRCLARERPDQPERRELIGSSKRDTGGDWQRFETSRSFMRVSTENT